MSGRKQQRARPAVRSRADGAPTQRVRRRPAGHPPDPRAGGTKKNRSNFASTRVGGPSCRLGSNAGYNLSAPIEYWKWLEMLESSCLLLVSFCRGACLQYSSCVLGCFYTALFFTLVTEVFVRRFRQAPLSCSQTCIIK